MLDRLASAFTTLNWSSSCGLKKGEEMLGFVNQDRAGAPVPESLLDGVVVIGGNSAIVRERGHRLRAPVDGMQAPLAVNQRLLHLQQ